MLGFGSSKKDSPAPVSLQDIVAAQAHIRKVLPITSLTTSVALSERSGIEVLLKWENKLKTGSFKERGAVNALSTLSEKQRARGVCAASLGNHALALSHHSARFKVPCVIVMPLNAPLIKIQSTKNTGAEVILHGQNFNEAYEYALKLADERGLRFVSAFDDRDVIAGQGTAGLELLDQCSDFDSVIVPVGGGGLISGIATAIKSHRPEVFVLGVRSDWVTKSHEKGQAVAPLLPSVSIADGIAVKRPGQLTAPIIKQYVDKVISLSEAEIADSIIGFLELERVVVEGAGAVGFSAVLGKYLPSSCKKAIIVVSGSNIDMNVLSRLIERDMGERGRLLRIVASVPDRPGSLHTVTGILSRAGANVLQVVHDRSFSQVPGNVDITFLLEVKDSQHKTVIIKTLRDAELDVRELA
ncbi:MAG: threonine ammonia-lyase [Deltaproteobacteria bacterium]|nr:threonine ammonia-lyase [Deltaproteobacteria bacterium]